MAVRGRLQQPSRQRQMVVGALALSLILALLVLPGGWQAALLLLLLLAPALGFFAWVFQQQQHHGVTDQELKQVALCFAAGAFPTPLLAMVAQSLLLPLWTLLCFFDQRESLRAQLQSYLDASSSTADSSSSSSWGANAEASGSGSSSGLSSPPPHASRLADVLLQLDVDKTFGYYVFLFVLAFCVAALVEEWLKLWVVQGTCCGACCAKSGGSKRGGLCHPSRLLFQHQRHSSHAFVVFMAVVAGALGFSVFENVGYAFGAGGFRDCVLAAVLRGCVSTPLHCICGGITGVRLAERLQLRRRAAGGSATAGERKLTAADDLVRWRTKLSILAPSIALHGVFDFQVLLVASLVTEEMAVAHPVAYGIVAPSAGTLAILVGGFVYLRRALHAMEHEMNAGRYIQVAVDLESGRRVGFSDSDDDDDLDTDEDFGAQEREFGRGGDGSPRRTRSVFNV